MASERAVAAGITRYAPDGSVLKFYLWSMIPGWPHFARNQHIRAHLFLWGFLSFLFVGLALMGCLWGSICIGLAFSIHSSAIADLINQRFADATVSERMLRGLAVSAVLFALIYWPAGMLISRVAAPYRLEVPLHPFETGDVVLASSIREPRVGDVVLYDIPNVRGELTLREGTRQRIIGGRNIDRILACPGSTVEFRDGRLLVDGRQAAMRPLNLMNYRSGWKQVVPAGDYFVLPSAQGDMLGDLQVLQLLSFVPQDGIVGRVFVRSVPWSRFSIIR